MAAKAQRVRLGPQNVVVNIRFWFFGYVFCYVAIWQTKSIKIPPEERRKKTAGFSTRFACSLIEFHADIHMWQMQR